MNDTNLVIVGGAPRSGTTLVRRLIGAHSAVYAGPEFDFIPNFVNLRDRMHKRIGDGRIDKITDPETVDQAIGGALRHIFDTRRDRAGAQVYVEKSPHNVVVFSQLLQLFPDARFVFVLRNPYGVLQSMQQVGERYLKDGREAPDYTRDTRLAVRLINQYWAAGFRVAENRRVRVVYYEDVLADPAAQSQALCDFVGLPFEEGMIRIEDAQYDNPTDATVGYWYSQKDFTKPIDDSKLTEDPAAAASPEDRRIMERRLARHPLLARYGFGGDATPNAARRG